MSNRYTVTTAIYSDLKFTCACTAVVIESVFKKIERRSYHQDICPCSVGCMGGVYVHTGRTEAIRAHNLLPALRRGQ